MLAKNAVVAWNGQTFRVLFVNSKEIGLYELNDKSSITCRRHPLEQIKQAQDDGSITVIADPFEQLRFWKPADAAEKKLDHNYELIKNIVADDNLLYTPKALTAALTETAKVQNINVRKLYRLVARYFKCGQCRNALMPDYRNVGKNKKYTKPPGRKSITGEPIALLDDKLKKLFDRVLKSCVLRENGMSVDRAYAELLNAYAAQYPDEAPRPSRTQLRNYYYRTYSRRDRNLARNPGRIYNKDIRPVAGNVYDMVCAAGQLYEIDATVDNVYLVASFDRTESVGRPTLYLVSDVFTGLITGVNVTFENAQYKSAAEALFCAIMPKQLYFKQYWGIDLNFDWPVSGIPSAVCADNAELLSCRVDSFAKSFDISTHNTAPYRGDMKGTIESSIGQVQSTIEFLLKTASPPAVFGPKKAGIKDLRTNGHLTIHEYRLLVLSAIDEVNCHIRDQHLPDQYPIRGLHNVTDIWNWAAETGRCVLSPVTDFSAMRVSLLPRWKASVSRRGIGFSLGNNVPYIRYFCSELEKEGWFDRDRESKQVYEPQICVSSGNVSLAFVCPDPQKAPNRYYECKLAPECAFLDGSTLPEARAALKLKSKTKAQSKQKRDIKRAEASEYRKKISRQAQKLTDSAGKEAKVQLTQGQQIEKIKANRAQELNAEAAARAQPDLSIIKGRDVTSDAPEQNTSEGDDVWNAYSDSISAVFRKPR